MLSKKENASKYKLKYFITMHTPSFMQSKNYSFNIIQFLVNLLHSKRIRNAFSRFLERLNFKFSFGTNHSGANER